jgi:cytochrome c oxidase subunit 3
MGTTIYDPPKIKPRPPVTPGGNGGGQGANASAGNLPQVKDRPPEPARTGIWVGLAAIAMTFAAFTSALIVRRGGNDWQPIALPRILFLNTAVLVASSITLEVARRRISGFIRNQGVSRVQAMKWLLATFCLGLLFVAGQYVAWLQLRAEGLYLATNPNSSFFYLLTAVHAIHVLGGLSGLLMVVWRLSRRVPTLRKSTLDATSYYWHFMGILWIYLLFVLWLKV